MTYRSAAGPSRRRLFETCGCDLRRVGAEANGEQRVAKWGNGRAAGSCEPALVLRRTAALQPAQPAQHERDLSIAGPKRHDTRVLMLSSRATRGVRRSKGCAGIAETPEARADGRFRICGPASEREEASVHVERRARARAAVCGGWGECDSGVVELERGAGDELCEALRDQLVTKPFGLAEVFPAVAPVLPEAMRVADAPEARDVAEDRRKPGDEGAERPGPCWGLALCLCVMGFCDSHAADYTAAIDPADS